MLANDRKGLKDLLTTLRKEKVTASADDEEEEEAEEDETARGTRGDRPKKKPSSRSKRVSRRGSSTHRRLPRRRGSRQTLGQGSGVLAGLVGKQRARETDSEYQARIEAEATKLIKRVVATGEFYLVRAGNTRKGYGHVLHPPATGRADRPPHAGAAVLRQGRGWHARPEETGGHPRPESLRSGLRQCLVPRGRPALPDRCPLQVALSSPPPGRPGPGQEAHAALGRCPARDEIDEELVPFPPERSAPRRHLRGAGQGPAAAACRRAVHLRCGHQPAGRGIGPCVAVGGNARPRICRSRSSTTRSRSATRWSAAGWTGWRTIRSRRGSGKAATARTAPRTQRIETFLKGEKSRQPAVGRWPDQAGDAEAASRPGSRAISPSWRCLITVLRCRRPVSGTSIRSCTICRSTTPMSRKPVSGDRGERAPPGNSSGRWTNGAPSGSGPRTRSRFGTSPHRRPSRPSPSEARSSLIRHLATDLKFFHWELEFPDVFTPERSGFDALDRQSALGCDEAEFPGVLHRLRPTLPHLRQASCAPKAERTLRDVSRA